MRGASQPTRFLRSVAFAAIFAVSPTLTAAQQATPSTSLTIYSSTRPGAVPPELYRPARVSQLDAIDQSLELVGEDVLDHTPKDETVLIRLGSAFDIVGK